MYIIICISKYLQDTIHAQEIMYCQCLMIYCNVSLSEILVTYLSHRYDGNSYAGIAYCHTVHAVGELYQGNSVGPGTEVGGEEIIL